MITICHPGRYGDLLWAAPSIRALAEQHNCKPWLLLPTDPANTTPMRQMVELFRRQEYIGGTHIMADWSIVQDAPRMPLRPLSIPEDASSVYCLGYREWPPLPLPYYTAELAGEDVYREAVEDSDHFFRPWIQAPPLDFGLANRALPHLVVSWTDRYFELKLGILKEIERNMPELRISWYTHEGSRMQAAGATACEFRYLASAFSAPGAVVLTDCSAAHVLAAAVGVKAVLVVEPEEARHHYVFWPGSETTDERGIVNAGHWRQRATPLGRRIRPVLGGDHRPTFDSRHTIDAIREALDAH